MDRQDLSTSYSPEYFQGIAADSDGSAEVVVPMLIDLVGPASVIDVGCGTGTWLDHFHRSGVREITGVDGPWVDKSALSIPQSSFEVMDLAHPPQQSRTFDLVVSLEVAEHLPADSADSFVELLTSLGPVVAFSAAIPAQGGNGHVNEQWPMYWSDRFAARGYVPFDLIRAEIWSDERVAWWFRQNLILYVDRERVSRYERLRDLPVREVLPLVHPHLYSAHLHAAASS